MTESLVNKVSGLGTSLDENITEPEEEAQRLLHSLLLFSVKQQLSFLLLLSSCIITQNSVQECEVIVRCRPNVVSVLYTKSRCSKHDIGEKKLQTECFMRADASASNAVFVNLLICSCKDKTHLKAHHLD